MLTNFKAKKETQDRPDALKQEQSKNNFFSNDLSETLKSLYKKHEIRGVNYSYKNRNKPDQVGDLFHPPLLPQENERQLIAGKVNENFWLLGNSQNNNEPQFYKKNEEIKDYGTLRKKFISYIHFNIHNDSKDGNIIQNANQVRTWEHRKFEIVRKIKGEGEREKFKKAVERRVLAKFDEVKIKQKLKFIFF